MTERKLKVIVRHLPHDLTQKSFLDVLDTKIVDKISYLQFKPGKPPNKQRSRDAIPSWAVFRLTNIAAVESLAAQIDGKPWGASGGSSSTVTPVCVEYTPLQKSYYNPPQAADILVGTIESDPDFIAFAEAQKNPPPVSSLTLDEWLKQEAAKSSADASTKLVDALIRNKFHGEKFPWEVSSKVSSSVESKGKRDKKAVKKSDKKGDKRSDKKGDKKRRDGKDVSQRKDKKEKRDKSKRVPQRDEPSGGKKRDSASKAHHRSADHAESRKATSSAGGEKRAERDFRERRDRQQKVIDTYHEQSRRQKGGDAAPATGAAVPELPKPRSSFTVTSTKRGGKEEASGTPPAPASSSPKKVMIARRPPSDNS